MKIDFFRIPVLLFLTLLFLSLHAQQNDTLRSLIITREQADAIVLEHIQNEVTSPYLLYVSVNLPTEDGIALTTHKKENMKVKYACWAYYLNENPEVSKPARHRYLFVKENDGNLLEVITYNDLRPDDLTQWMLIPLGVNEMTQSAIRIFPNPTTGELTITNYELQITDVEIYDIYGRKFNPSVPQSLNISHLQSGIYFIRITIETGIVTKKVIKN